MALSKLDHVNVRTANLADMKAFYTEILGMTLGVRPPFSFNGAWLYCGDQATVHLVEVDEQPAPEGALRLEHFAFSASGLKDFLDLLRSRGVAYRLGLLPGFGLVQVNIHDPDGNRIHVDFAPSEAEDIDDEPALAAT